MTIPDSTTTAAPVDFTSGNLKLSQPDECKQMLGELERRMREAKDFVAPAGKLHMTDEGKFAIESGEWQASVIYDVRDVAHKQLAEKMGIPRTYYNRLLEDSPKMLAANVNHWLKHEAESRKFMIRTLPDTQGNTWVRAFLSDRFLSFASYDVFMHAAQAAMKHEAKIISVYDDEEHTRLKMMLPQFGFRVTGRYSSGPTQFVPGHRDEGTGRWVAPPGEGTLVFPGISVSNSEVGLGALTATLDLRVGACDNSIALKLGETFRRIHLGPRMDEGKVFKDDTKEAREKAIWMECRDLIDAAFQPETIAKLVDECNRTQSEQLDDPVKAVNAVVENYNLGDDEKQAIINELVAPSSGDTAGATVWGLINAVTARAHAKTSVAETVKFEEAGGALMDADQVLVKVRA